MYDATMNEHDLSEFDCTINEAAHILGITRGGIWSRISRGTLPSVQRGLMHFVRRADLKPAQRRPEHGE
jgi:hypothetical protein